MEVRRSKDDQGFQAETKWSGNDVEHMVTFRMKAVGPDEDRVTFSGTFDGTVGEWDAIVTRVDDITNKYEEERRAGE